MAHALSILASLTLVVVVFIYFRQVVKGHSVPNSATWFIWMAVGVLNTVTYFVVTKGNLFEWLITLVATLGLSAIFLYSLIRGKFGKLSRLDVMCTVIAIAIGVFWQATGDAIMANILLQVIFAISFYPTVVGLVRKQLRDRPLPWILEATAYVFSIIAVALNWQDGSGVKLVHLIVNGILGNGSVAITIWWMNRRQTAPVQA